MVLFFGRKQEIFTRKSRAFLDKGSMFLSKVPSLIEGAKHVRSGIDDPKKSALGRSFSLSMGNSYDGPIIKSKKDLSRGKKDSKVHRSIGVT